MGLDEQRMPVAIGELETDGRGHTIDLRDLALEMKALADAYDDQSTLTALEALASRLLPRITDLPMRSDRNPPT